MAGEGRLSDLALESGSGVAVVLVSHALAGHPLVAAAVASLGDRCAGVVAVRPRPSPDFIAGLATVYASRHPAVVVGIGGGAAIDAAKALACWCAYGGPTSRADGRVPRLIVVPSTSAAAAVTGAAALYESGRLVRVADPRLAPAVVILDPKVAITAPSALALASGLMALAHGIETTFSLARDPYSTWLALGGIGLIGSALERLAGAPTSLAVRWDLQTGSLATSLAIRSARGCLQHAAAHALLIHRAVPHATAHALLLPHTLRMRPEVIAAPMAAVRAALGGIDHVDSWIEELARRGGLPARLGLLGISRADLGELADTISADRGRLDLDPRRMTTRDIETMLERAL